MKKSTCTFLLLIGSFLFHIDCFAQNKKGVQPPWGPAGVKQVRYYYFPDLGFFYDIPNALFIYSNKGKYLRTPKPPVLSKRYDLYKTYKVVLNINTENPQAHLQELVKQYPAGSKWPNQPTIKPPPAKKKPATKKAPPKKVKK